MSNESTSNVRSFLAERYRQFRSEGFVKHESLFSELAKGQSPRVLFITCSDSRVVPHVILSAAPGDIFECKIVGNIVPAYGDTFGGVSATLEYAISVLKVEAVIVCGHSDCGAMKATLSGAYSNVPTVAHWLRHSDVAKRIVDAKAAESSDCDMIDLIAHENVIAQIDNMRTHPAVALGLRNGLELIGWVYDIKTGGIANLDHATRSFAPLA